MKLQKKGGKTLRFLQKPSCTTCRKAKAFVEKCGWEIESRDLGKERLSAAEIETPVVRVGWPDHFIEHGKPEALRAKYGLTAEAAMEKVRGMLKRPVGV